MSPHFKDIFAHPGLRLDSQRQHSQHVIHRLTKSEYHVDNYGFKHTYQNEGLLLHYICQQLHQFYTLQLESYEDHQRRWKDVLTRAKSTLIKTVRRAT